MRFLKHITLTACLILLLSVSALAQDVRFAVVRITSHGCSGTVIETGDDKSLILTCAHAFQGEMATKLLSLDRPCDPARVPEPVRARMRIVHIDSQLDLTLIEVAHGPFPVVCPLAPPGHQPGKAIWSVGYDEKKWPATMRPATIIGSARGGDITATRERPWHGRSGGGLIDLDAKALIGVTSFYTGPQSRDEVVPDGWGGYVSHQACLRFLQRLLGGNKKPDPPGSAPGAWRIEQEIGSQTQRPLVTNPSPPDRATNPPVPLQRWLEEKSRPAPKAWPPEPPRQVLPPSVPGSPFPPPCPDGRR